MHGLLIVTGASPGLGVAVRRTGNECLRKGSQPSEIVPHVGRSTGNPHQPIGWASGDAGAQPSEAFLDAARLSAHFLDAVGRSLHSVGAYESMNSLN